MNIKKELLLTVSALTLSALILTGCGNQNSKPQTPSTNPPETSAPDQQGTENEQAESLLAVVEMLGKSDEDVKDLYNGGTENKTEDGSILLGRSYSTTLDGNAVTLETVYSEDQTVSSISASFTDKTADEVKAIMSDAFGEPEVNDETQAMDSKRLTWTKDQVSIVMNESYGMSIVEFTQING